MGEKVFCVLEIFGYLLIEAGIFLVNGPAGAGEAILDVTVNVLERF